MSRKMEMIPCQLSQAKSSTLQGKKLNYLIEILDRVEGAVAPSPDSVNELELD